MTRKTTPTAGNAPVPPRASRATCRMTTARGNRCTGEALDPDLKAIQICARHAGEVLALINERTSR
ncbi:hypothetical protein [Nocardiopsis synnemataformans]|uniref:hypothetical protein n=1 Tax=Nocardiopsis synnemataformans TaxID=61305 RepID=UPI003EB76AFE